DAGAGQPHEDPSTAVHEEGEAAGPHERRRSGSLGVGDGATGSEGRDLHAPMVRSGSHTVNSLFVPHGSAWSTIFDGAGSAVRSASSSALHTPTKDGQ